MSDTVILAVITALSAICVACISAYDRRTLYARRTTSTADVAEQLLSRPVPAK